jgi:hypothetical protein
MLASMGRELAEQAQQRVEPGSMLASMGREQAELVAQRVELG